MELEPQAVWRYFDEITRVPRPSKKEEKILQYLKDFAVANALQWKQDATGNIVITRPAAPGWDQRPVVVLQSHVDMVCEKNSDVAFDFTADPIRTVVDGEWVRAEGTTLGADDGIGMAAAMALLTARGEELPALEALFTVDEETGLTGAFGLGEDMITGKYLINLDSEDEGEIFIGCAGGVDTLAEFSYSPQKLPDGYVCFRIDVSGLKGGHSGDNINDGLANSNKLVSHILWRLQSECGARLSAFDGGNLRNAIPREAYAVVGVEAVMVKRLFEIMEAAVAGAHEQYGRTEPGLEITFAEIAPCARVIDQAAQRGLVLALAGMQNGVLAMSREMPGLVETSSNLASVKFPEPGRIVVTTSQRSSLESAKWDAARSIESVLALGGGRVTHSEGYPGWAPDQSSQLLETTRRCYVELFGNEPKIRAIHAGLECGLFLTKYPGLEMVSFGPTLRGVHSPDERLEIKTVDKFWKLLLKTIKSIR